jgi:hypothetical protein
VKYINSSPLISSKSHYPLATSASGGSENTTAALSQTYQVIVVSKVGKYRNIMNTEITHCYKTVSQMTVLRFASKIQSEVTKILIFYRSDLERSLYA